MEAADVIAHIRTMAYHPCFNEAFPQVARRFPKTSYYHTPGQHTMLLVWLDL